jgi:hypothetical protein
MDVTGLTGEEIIAANRKHTEDLMREYAEFIENILREKKEQKREEWENFEKEIGLPYEKDLQDGKYIFIF